MKAAFRDLDVRAGKNELVVLAVAGNHVELTAADEGRLIGMLHDARCEAEGRVEPDEPVNRLVAEWRATQGLA